MDVSTTEFIKLGIPNPRRSKANDAQAVLPVKALHLRQAERHEEREGSANGMSNTVHDPLTGASSDLIVQLLQDALPLKLTDKLLGHDLEPTVHQATLTAAAKVCL
mmetsp:Transcript_13544/g.29769  ORF Transcript_13544/g.29769 Transcript_13544/m.29769 type:complete len:106 (+) Transcript_13544:1298-1615(+)